MFPMAHMKGALTPKETLGRELREEGRAASARLKERGAGESSARAGAAWIARKREHARRKRGR